MDLTREEARWIDGDDAFYASTAWAEWGSTLDVTANASKPSSRNVSAHDSDELSDEEVFLFGVRQQDRRAPARPEPTAAKPAPGPSRKVLESKARQQRRRDEMLTATLLAISASKATPLVATDASFEAPPQHEAPERVFDDETSVAAEPESAAEPQPSTGGGGDGNDGGGIEEDLSPEQARTLFAQLGTADPTLEFSAREARLQQALNVSYAQRSSKMTIAADASLGHLYIERGLYRQAIAHLNSAISLARKETGFPPAALASLERMLAKAYVEAGDSRNAAAAVHQIVLPASLAAQVDAAVEGGLKSTVALQQLVDVYAGGPFGHCLARAHPQTGVTPLHVAAAKGDAELVRALLAYVPLRPVPTDNLGHSPLVWAARFNADDSVLKLLVDAGMAPSQDDVVLDAPARAAIEARLRRITS